MAALEPQRDIPMPTRDQLLQRLARTDGAEMHAPIADALAAPDAVTARLVSAREIAEAIQSAIHVSALSSRTREELLPTVLEWGSAVAPEDRGTEVIQLWSALHKEDAIARQKATRNQQLERMSWVGVGVAVTVLLGGIASILVTQSINLPARWFIVAFMAAITTTVTTALMRGRRLSLSQWLALCTLGLLVTIISILILAF